MKHSLIIQFADNAIKFNIASNEILEAIDVHFGHCMGEEQTVIAQYQVEASQEAGFSIQKDGKTLASDITTEQVLFHLMQDGLTTLNGESKTNLVFHSAALAHQERGLLLCGKSGSGKSTLTAWLTAQGFQYLSDEVIALPFSGEEVSGFCRSLVLKRGSEMIWKGWHASPGTESKDFLKMEDGSAWVTPTFLNPSAVRASVNPHVILFPTYNAEADFKAEPLSPAKTLFLLLQCLVNARNFDDYGRGAAKKLAQKVSAYQLVYSDIEQAAEWIQKTITG